MNTTHFPLLIRKQEFARAAGVEGQRLTSLVNSRIIKEVAQILFKPTLKPRTQFGKVLPAVLIVLLCVVLAVFMTVEVAHTDPAGAAHAAHCQLCASAHIAVDTQPLWMTAYVLRLIERVAVGEVRPGSSPVVVTAFIRPPPFAR